MGATLHTITVDCADPARLAEFWGAVLDQPVRRDPADDHWAAVGGEKQRSFRLLFLRVPEPKSVKNRLHLDLTATTTRAAEVERAVALGATVVREWDHGRWTVLHDPEGNEFCVLRSLAEQQPDRDEDDEQA